MARVGKLAAAGCAIADRSPVVAVVIATPVVIDAPSIAFIACLRSTMICLRGVVRLLSPVSAAIVAAEG